MEYTAILIQGTLMPDTLAVTSLPPTAYTLRPKTVLVRTKALMAVTPRK